DRGTHEGVRDPAMEDQVFSPRARGPQVRFQYELGPVRRIGGDRADPSGGRYVATCDGAAERGADEGMGEGVHVVLKASIALAGLLAGRYVCPPPAASEKRHGLRTA